MSKILLNIKGKNINRFIKRLRNNKIDVLRIKYKGKNEANIIIKKVDYSKVIKIKSIYDITELGVFGFLKVKRRIKKSRHLIIFLMFGFIVFVLLTNVIFDIEIVHSNKDIRDLLKKELENNGIKLYSFKKSYDKIKKIKESILNKYPDRIEWLEITASGTKYIVRVEERKIPNNNVDSKPRNIIAKKAGIIKKVIAKNGEIIRDMDDYVEKGDLIISGDLIFNNEVKGRVRSDGEVYAEIWYLTKTSYPFVIDKKVLTGNEKNAVVIRFLNKSFEFSFNKFKYKKVKENKIIFHRFLPIEIVFQRQSEVRVVNQILTFDEALERAKKASIKKIKSKLNSREYIIRNTYLKSSVNNSTIDVEMFFAVYEDITDYVEIGE